MSLPVPTDAPPGPAHTGRTRRRGASGGLGRFLLWRSLTAFGTLLFVLVFNFFLFRLLPGDPAAQYRGVRSISGEDLARIRDELTAPIGQQFITYLQDPLAFNGVSSSTGRPVWDLIGGRFWPTVILLSVSTIMAVAIGVSIGIRAGWNRGSRFDKASTGVTLVLYGTPEFWLGLLLIMTLSGGLWFFPGIFPSGGFIDSGVDPWSLEGIASIAMHVALPATALAAVYLAEFSLIMRASMVDETGQDYLTTARAKGLMDRAVRRVHAVPNASLPTITLIFLHVGFILGGAITVEYVFSYPGLGQLTLAAVDAKDFAVMQALFLIFSLSVLFFNVVADVIIAIVDPRIRT